MFKFFVSIFQKLEEIIIPNRKQWEPSKIETFSAYYFSYARGYKAALRDDSKPWRYLTIIIKNFCCLSCKIWDEIWWYLRKFRDIWGRKRSHLEPENLRQKMLLNVTVYHPMATALYTSSWTTLPKRLAFL